MRWRCRSRQFFGKGRGDVSIMLTGSIFVSADCREMAWGKAIEPLPWRFGRRQSMESPCGRIKNSILTTEKAPANASLQGLVMVVSVTGSLASCQLRSAEFECQVVVFTTANRHGVFFCHTIQSHFHLVIVPRLTRLQLRCREDSLRA